jgi:cellobiose transport system permease protein
VGLLTDRNLLGPTHFVGLQNYANLIHDSYFWNAVENTLAIWVLDRPSSARTRSRTS